MGSYTWRASAEKWAGPISARQLGTMALTSDHGKPWCSSTCSVSITCKRNTGLNAFVSAKHLCHTEYCFQAGLAFLTGLKLHVSFIWRPLNSLYLIGLAAKTRIEYYMGSVLQVEEKGVVCVCTQYSSISLSVDYCKTAALQNVHSGHIKKIVKSELFRR